MIYFSNTIYPHKVPRSLYCVPRPNLLNLSAASGRRYCKSKFGSISALNYPTIWCFTTRINILSVIHMLLSSTKAIIDASKHTHTQQQQHKTATAASNCSTLDLTTARRRKRTCANAAVSSERGSEDVTLAFCHSAIRYTYDGVDQTEFIL